ncbi:hypothetical protein NKT34_18455 [Paenibacillus polysaccharolyticus]|uniref:hypothetical protein n=1 Tax=Paenibacillus polysaccharolyticus TaxID=582692 RepID=UPI0020A0118A|nr:hypothetical protein [Paenibacillus polysaccharolyticus]MCP1135285.1 hypothetical protein [Paenibacillus polysaccharolyticus]
MFAILKQKPDKMTLRALKVTSASIVFLVILFFIVIVYSLLYELVNVLDVKAYFRYASEGKFEQDFYFTEAEKAKTGIRSSLKVFLPDDVAPSRLQEYFKLYLQDETLLKKKMNENNKYIEYLKSNNVTVDDAVLYMKRIINLDEIFLYAAWYVGMLLFILILYFLYKWRISIFILSGILYFILVIDSFTAGIFLDAFFPVFQNIHSYSGKVIGTFDLLSYDDYLRISKSFLPAIREAALTFIILDTVVQSLKDSKKRRRSSRFLVAYVELEFTLHFLSEIKENLIITNLKTVNLEEIYDLCKENKSDEYMMKAKEKLDEWRKISRNKNMTVFESYERLLNIRNYLIKSKFIRENIIR